MRAAICVLACAGCWQSSPAGVGGSAPAHSTDPTGPAPRVAWDPETTDGRGIVLTGLPAVSRDAAVVIYGEDKGDGPRGNPNLALVTRARDDQMVERFVAVDPNAFEDLADPQRRARVVAANAYLGKQHATRAFVPMVVWPAPKFDEAGAPHTMTEGSLVVHWDDRRLRITDAGKVVVDRETPEGWLVHDYPMYQDAPELCSNPAFLGGVAVDRARKIALVTVSYEGTDTCQEPPSQSHVVAW